ncbi:MFS general substrate transporter [Rhizodiscina lignyota]|uniref:MFS general substrate transporter n=1 Tax=Rhizodiscina lignyota TaxID=1504668 RepID=A0A9P4IAF0_9PEZI|nr:MFS general substrate transporter [Rhizodiscina lignyota]
MSDKEIAEKPALEQTEFAESKPLVAPERAEYEALCEKFDEQRRKKLLRKIDLRLMPILTLLYLVSYMDRTNIGNARLLGLETDLGLSPQQYNWALTIFFFPYSFFEVPANLMLKFLRPSLWLSLIMLFWGITMMCMGWTQNYAGILAARFFLGVAEAGLFPGATYITTTWYRKNELQVRVAAFYCAASLAGSFSGLLAYGIGFMDGIRGYHGWRWIFILEGLLTICVATASYFLISDTPQEVKWLTDEEKRYYVKQAFTDSKCYVSISNYSFRVSRIIPRELTSHAQLGAFMFFVVACGTYAISFSLPTVINQLGYTAANAQLLTIPVYVYACIITLVNALSADHFMIRFPHVVVPLCSSLTGFVIALTVSPIEKPGVVYFSMFLIAGGLFPNTPAFVAWLSNNLAGQWKRAAGMALEFTIGNCLGGVIGSNIFLAREKPFYRTAYIFEISITCAGMVTAVLQAFLLWRTNTKRVEQVRKAEEEGRDLDAEFKDEGDKNPYFKYTL